VRVCLRKKAKKLLITNWCNLMYVLLWATEGIKCWWHLTYDPWPGLWRAIFLFFGREDYLYLENHHTGQTLMRFCTVNWSCILVGPVTGIKVSVFQHFDFDLWSREKNWWQRALGHSLFNYCHRHYWHGLVRKWCVSVGRLKRNDETVMCHLHPVGLKAKQFY